MHYTVQNIHPAEEHLVNELLNDSIAVSTTVELLHTSSRPECLSPMRTTHLKADVGGCTTI